MIKLHLLASKTALDLAKTHLKFTKEPPRMGRRYMPGRLRKDLRSAIKRGRSLHKCRTIYLQ